MFRQSLRRAVHITVAGALGLAGIVSAQSDHMNGSDGMAQLLSEVRALRTEITRAAGASMQMQMTIGLLSLQEQRIASLNRRATDVHARLTLVMRTRHEAHEQLMAIQNMAGSSDEPPNLDEAIAPFRTRLSEQQQQEQSLQAELANISTEISVEQGRWKAFHEQLEQLARSLPINEPAQRLPPGERQGVR